MSYEDYNEDSPRQTSSYNEAAFQIKRLNEKWLMAEDCALKAMFKKWGWILDSIYRELYPDIKKLANSEQIQKKNTFYLYKVHHAGSKAEIYFYLDQRHQFIKVLQDDCGKGSIYKDVDDEDFE